MQKYIMRLGMLSIPETFNALNGHESVQSAYAHVIVQSTEKENKYHIYFCDEEHISIDKQEAIEKQYALGDCNMYRLAPGVNPMGIILD